VLQKGFCEDQRRTVGAMSVPGDLAAVSQFEAKFPIQPNRDYYIYGVAEAVKVST
jgi:hypothetical protein